MEISALSPAALSHLAINAALESQWEDALEINCLIIKSEPENIDALNRLGRAYFELGKLELAKKHYKLALKVDVYNTIAQKNLKLIENCKDTIKPVIDQTQKTIGSILEHNNGKISPSLFLHEPGKTKIVNVLKVAEPQKLSTAYPGMSIDMLVKNRKIIVVDRSGTYLGVLPDDLAHRLFKLIKDGNKYVAFVKSVKVNGLSILIREVFRSKKLKNQPSFLEQHSAISSTGLLTSLTNDDNSSNNTQEPESEEFT